MISQEQEKYSSQDVAPPSEFREQVESLKGVETEVAEKAEEREKLLQSAKLSRQQYHTNVQKMKTWLEEAESQLQQPIGDLKQTEEKHKVHSSLLIRVEATSTYYYLLLL